MLRCRVNVVVACRGEVVADLRLLDGQGQTIEDRDAAAESFAVGSRGCPAPPTPPTAWLPVITQSSMLNDAGPGAKYKYWPAKIPPPNPFPPLPPVPPKPAPPVPPMAALAETLRAPYGQIPVAANAASVAGGAVTGCTAIRGIAAVAAERHVAADRAIGQSHCRTQ